MMTTDIPLRFMIPGAPRGQADKIAATRDSKGTPLRFPRFRMAPKDVVYRETCQAIALQSRPPGWEPLSSPCRIRILVVAPRPASACSKRSPRPVEWKSTKPDLKNVYRGIEDALVGIAYLDDNLVASVSLEKVVAAQGQTPATYVEVSTLAEEAPPKYPHWAPLVVPRPQTASEGPSSCQASTRPSAAPTPSHET